MTVSGESIYLYPYPEVISKDSKVTDVAIITIVVIVDVEAITTQIRTFVKGFITTIRSIDLIYTNQLSY